jgi:competence protein ComEC
MDHFIVAVLRRRPMVCLSLVLISGILTALVGLHFAPALFTFTVSVTVLFLLRDDFRFAVGLLVCVWALGWSQAGFALKRIQQKQAIVEKFHESAVSGLGIVVSKQESPQGWRLTIRDVVLTTTTDSLVSDVDCFLFGDDHSNPEVGDTVRFTGKYYRIEPLRNPGRFDFRDFYHRRNIFGRIFQDRSTPLIICKPARFSWRQSIGRTRQRIREHFQSRTDTEVAGLLSALILGDKSDVDPELKSAFVETGVVHVLAVSGLHVGYVLLILVILTSFLRVPWGWDRLVILLGLLVFVVLTGGKASVVRAAIMAGLYVIAPVINRPTDGWNIIATAAFLILIFNPLTVVDLGFLLSFSAVISIVFFYRFFERVLPEKLRPSHIKNRFLKGIWGLFLVSLSAQIGTLPLTAYYFGILPVVALIANVVIVPLVGVLVALGFTLLFLGWLPGLGFAFGQAAWLNMQCIDLCATLFSNVPFASIAVGGWGGVHLLLYILGVLFLVTFLQPSMRSRAYIIGIIFLNLIIWPWALQKRGMEVLFLDVGQGDAAIIQFDHGKTMLVDGGFRLRDRDMGKSVILPVANYLGIRKLDWVVMSHPHNDHIGGLISVIENLSADTVWDTYSDYDSWTYRRLRTLFEKQGIYYRRPQRGEVIRINPRTTIQILAPDTNWVKGMHNVNNLSIVFRLQYGNTSVLFTGDLEYEGDTLLLSAGKVLDSDVLKVAHHGSITSTTPSLLASVTPDVAVISVGRKNKFGHPSPVVLQRLERMGIRIYRTDQVGAVWLRSDGKVFREVQWR